MRRRAHTAWSCTALLPLLACASPSAATTYPVWGPQQVDSLEWKLTDADLVVRGRVVAIRDAPDWPPEVRGVATVSVGEVLKGESAATVECVVFGFVKIQELPPWQRDGTQGLWLLKTGKETAVGGRLLPGVRYYLPNESIAPLRRGARGAQLRLFSLERAKWLEPEELVDAARSALRDQPGNPGPTAPCRVMLPGDPQSDSVLHQIVVTCPVDGHLERLARQWVRSPNAWQRLGGVEALGHFPSGENVEILKEMVHDRALPMTHGVGKWRRQSSRTAIEAHRSLSAWGIRAPAPAIVQEDLPHHAVPAGRASVAAGLLASLLLAPLAAGVFRSRRPPTTVGRVLNPLGTRRRRMLNAAAAVAVVLCALSTWLWIRSHSRIDELTLARAGDNHELSSSPGGVRYWRGTHWPEDRPLSYGSFDTREAYWFNPDGSKRFQASSGYGAPQLYGWQPRAKFHEVAFPWWSVMAAFGLLPLALAVGIVKRWRRLMAPGTCVNCGYDLRASTGRCPECGESIVPRRASAKPGRPG